MVSIKHPQGDRPVELWQKYNILIKYLSIY